VEASLASLFFFAQPLVGVLLSAMILNQKLDANVLIGGILIIGGVILSMQRSATAERAPVSQT
jgi:drug/metabolite transporter (DMT)-like permease